MFHQWNLIVGRIFHTVLVRRNTIVHPIWNTSFTLTTFLIKAKELNPYFDGTWKQTFVFSPLHLEKKYWKRCLLCPWKHIKQVDNGWDASVKGQFVLLQNYPLGILLWIKKWRKYNLDEVTKHTSRTKQNVEVNEEYSIFKKILITVWKTTEFKIISRFHITSYNIIQIPVINK